MSKTLIVTGGSINVAWAKEWLDNQTFDYCIAADSGLEYGPCRTSRTAAP